MVYNSPIVGYRHAQVSLVTIQGQCCLIVLRPDEELRELESMSSAIVIMFCIREKVLLLDKNFFTNILMVDIVVFTTAIISTLATIIIPYLLCKHNKLRTLVPSLVLQ